MQNIKKSGFKKTGVWVLFVIFSFIFATANSINAYAEAASNQDNESNAAALLQKYDALKAQLAKNQYRRPLFLESLERTDKVSSNAYAILDSPFTTVSTAFKTPSHWCEILILHINTKYCRTNTDTNDSTLTVNIGKKTPQALSDAFLLKFSYRLMAASSNYLAVQLHSDQGPLSTTDYRIELQAVPLSDGHTFINLSYSYGYGMAGRLAMQAYLATVGRGKIGFTQISQDEKPVYVSGMRGTVERNTMRYYLAIEAYLASLKQPVSQQFNTRLQYWFDATEEYSIQLHEVDRPDYLAMKKAEYLRQQR